MDVTADLLFTNQLYDEHNTVSRRSHFINTPDSTDSDYAMEQNELGQI